MRTAKWIGLTGGIAAGKSMAADWLIKNGVPVLDMDKIGRELSVTPQALRVFETIFGEDVFTHGVINRRLVREQIFQSPEKRKQLEDYLHPLAWKEFEKQAAALEAQGKKIVVCEAALIFEAEIHKKLDEVIVILADEKLRLERASKRDQLTPQMFEAISKSQVTNSERRQLATHVLINDGHFDHVANQLNAVLESWKKKGWL